MRIIDCITILLSTQSYDGSTQFLSSSPSVMYNVLSWSGGLVRGRGWDGGLWAEEANVEGLEHGLFLGKQLRGWESLLWPSSSRGRWCSAPKTEEKLVRREAASPPRRVWEWLAGTGLPSSLLLAPFPGSLTRRLFIPIPASSGSAGLYRAAGSRLWKV